MSGHRNHNGEAAGDRPAIPGGTPSPAHSSQGRNVRLVRIPAPCAITRDWAFGDGSGEGVRVCLLDSGVDGGHPDVGDLAGSYHVAALAVGHAVVPDAAVDVAGHGTTCAAIVRALAPGCEITSIRILGRRLHGHGEALVAALRWALERRFPLINLSMSTSRPDLVDPLRELCDRAYFDGTAIVAAAHNRPVASFPWRFPSVVSVGSHAVPDFEYLEANPAPPVEFFGRGMNVDGAGVRSGNSFAAAHVTGLCGRILGAHPGFGVPQLKVVLAAIADNNT
jgi:subtilisin family serine protease